MKRKNFSKKKGKNSTFKDIIYGLKMLYECGDKLVITRIISVLSFWFFTGFVEDILLLKYLLQALENGVSFKNFVIVCLIFLGLSITGRFLNNYFDYLTGLKNKVFYIYSTVLI